MLRLPIEKVPYAFSRKLSMTNRLSSWSYRFLVASSWTLSSMKESTAFATSTEFASRSASHDEDKCSRIQHRFYL